MTAIVEEEAPGERKPKFLWLDITRKCQLKCAHCYNSSGPEGDHGSMTREDWLAVLDEAASCGVRRVQLIGGEPTMHPQATELVEYALTIGLSVEVFSNLVHVNDGWWELFRRPEVSVATSYYSDRAVRHDVMTGRNSHARTRTNIGKAVKAGVRLRVGIIVTKPGQDVSAVRQDLESLGVTRIGVDYVRPFGRGTVGGGCDPSALCGQCGKGRAAVGPSGAVSPCVFSTWMNVGNVRTAKLSTILGGTPMVEATATIRRAVQSSSSICEPDDDPEEECTPGVPGSSCTPRN